MIKPDAVENGYIGAILEKITSAGFKIVAMKYTQLSRRDAEAFYAIADVCSHDDGPLAEGDVEGHEVICPRHGAHFDLQSGKALSLPAVVDIPAYPVRVEGDEILVGVPVEG